MIFSNRRRGFTLLETILAVGLSALLIALMGAGIRIYTRTVAQRRADVVNAQVARVILLQIANDLRAAYMASDDSSSPSGDVGTDDGTESDTGTAGDTETEGTLDEQTTADFSTTAVQPSAGLFGNSTQLQIDVLGKPLEPIKFDTLTVAGVDPKAANLLSDPKVITYYLRSISPGELAGTVLESLGDSGEQMVLVRRVASRAEAAFASSYGATADASGDQLISDQVIALQFMYHDGFDWVDSWDSSLNGGLPVAVNISLAIVDETSSDTSSSSLTTDVLYEQTVYLPTAEIPDTSTLGI